MFNSLFYATGVIVNLLMWFYEWKTGRILRLLLDLGGTWLVVQLAGGNSVTAAAGGLWASMIWSIFLTKMAKFPDWRDLKKEIKVMVVVFACVLIIAGFGTGIIQSIAGNI